jgi:RHS repeat-associated protein
VGFVYDGDGNRVSKTVDGESTAYLWDAALALPVVVVETTGTDDTLYTYGGDLIAITDPDASHTTYHYDGLGSTRQLSDETGQVVASYSYKPFGGLRTMTGASGNAHRFTGEQTDDEIGLLYLRARYYDPEIGRFITKDPLPGFSTSPQSLNRYAYAHNNPINLTDPTGEVFNLGLAAVGAVVGGVVGVASYYVTDVVIRGEDWDTTKALTKGRAERLQVSWPV